MNQRILKAIIEKSIEGNKARYIIQIPKDLCNNFGVVHGGAVHLIYLTLQKDHIYSSTSHNNLSAVSTNIHFLSSIKSNEFISVLTNYNTNQDPTLYYSTSEFLSSANQAVVLCSSIIKSHVS